jgi:hypothetical protein
MWHTGIRMADADIMVDGNGFFLYGLGEFFSHVGFQWISGGCL